LGIYWLFMLIIDYIDITSVLSNHDHREVHFNPQKILHAIIAAGRASGEFEQAAATHICQQVLQKLPTQITLDIEDIQDCVETTLMQAGYLATARAYIVYREQRSRARRERKTLVDVAASMNEYLSREDWRVRAKAKQG